MRVSIVLFFILMTAAVAQDLGGLELPPPPPSPGMGDDTQDPGDTAQNDSQIEETDLPQDPPAVGDPEDPTDSGETNATPLNENALEHFPSARNTNLLVLVVGGMLGLSVIINIVLMIALIKKRSEPIITSNPKEDGRISQLKTYLKSNLNSYAYEDLKRNLIANGWDEKDVEEAYRKINGT